MNDPCFFYTYSTSQSHFYFYCNNVCFIEVGVYVKNCKKTVSTRVRDSYTLQSAEITFLARHEPNCTPWLVSPFYYCCFILRSVSWLHYCLKGFEFLRTCFRKYFPGKIAFFFILCLKAFRDI